MRRGAPKSLGDIRHPGPAAGDRCPHAVCQAAPVKIQLPAGAGLLGALGEWASQKGYASAVLDLSGISLSSFDYVMPDRAIDDRHAAWYSETVISKGARLSEAVAILGWRDGAWFAHIHGFWQDGRSNHLGHLLPHTLSLASAAEINGYGIKGARFEAAHDPETEFTLFRVKKDENSAFQATANALITTLAPFADLCDSIGYLSEKLDARAFNVLGLGSLAGATFEDGPAMTGLISEILVRRGAGRSENQPLKVPVRTVDYEKNLFQGIAAPEKCPTLITCELLLVSKDT